MTAFGNIEEVSGEKQSYTDTTSKVLTENRFFKVEVGAVGLVYLAPLDELLGEFD